MGRGSLFLELVGFEFAGWGVDVCRVVRRSGGCVAFVFGLLRAGCGWRGGLYGLVLRSGKGFEGDARLVYASQRFAQQHLCACVVERTCHLNHARLQLLRKRM